MRSVIHSNGGSYELPEWGKVLSLYNIFPGGWHPWGASAVYLEAMWLLEAFPRSFLQQSRGEDMNVLPQRVVTICEL